jgi:hypothetical protein
MGSLACESTSFDFSLNMFYCVYRKLLRWFREFPPAAAYCLDAFSL